MNDMTNRLQPTTSALLAERERVTREAVRECRALPERKGETLRRGLMALAAAQGISEEAFPEWMERAAEPLRRDAEDKARETKRQRDRIATDAYETWLALRRRGAGDLRPLSRTLPTLAEVGGRLHDKEVVQWLTELTSASSERDIPRRRAALDMILTFSDSEKLPLFAPLLHRLLLEPAHTIFADSAILLLLLAERYPHIESSLRPALTKELKRRLRPPASALCQWHLWDAPETRHSLPFAFRILRESDPERYAGCVAAIVLSRLFQIAVGRGETPPRDPEIESALWDKMKDPSFVVGAVAAECAAARVGWSRLYESVLHHEADPRRMLRCLGRMGGGLTECPDIFYRTVPFLRAEDPRLQAAAIDALQQLACAAPLPFAEEEETEISAIADGKGCLAHAAASLTATLTARRRIGAPADREAVSQAISHALLASVADDLTPQKSGSRPDAPAEPAEILYLVKSPHAPAQTVLPLLRASADILRETRRCQIFLHESCPVLLMTDFRRYAAEGDAPLFRFLTDLTRRLTASNLKTTLLLHRDTLNVERVRDGYRDGDTDLFAFPALLASYLQYADFGYVLATGKMGKSLSRIAPFDRLAQDIGERRLDTALTAALFLLNLTGRSNAQPKPFSAA